MCHKFWVYWNQNASTSETNTYQSLIYLISTIDNDYEDNLKKLKNIFNIYLSNLKDIEKDNSNQLTRDSRPYQEVNVEGKDKLGVFDFF